MRPNKNETGLGISIACGLMIELVLSTLLLNLLSFIKLYVMFWKYTNTIIFKTATVTIKQNSFIVN